MLVQDWHCGCHGIGSHHREELPLVLGSQAVQGTVDFEPKGDVEPKSITIAVGHALSHITKSH